MVKVFSPAFEDGARIPRRYTRDGFDVSPPIHIGDLPEGTRELALVCTDADTATGTWVHWVLYGVPATKVRIPASLSKVPRPSLVYGAVHGRSSWDRCGYGGPDPPRGHGEHRYCFTAYALAEPLGLPPGLTASELLEAMEGRTLGTGVLTGTYERSL